jgi:hypothetical protein
MTTTERIWRRDFTNLTEAIPPNWLITTEDGLMWILPEHQNNRIVKLYQDLYIIGAAKGWL